MKTLAFPQFLSEAKRLIRKKEQKTGSMPSINHTAITLLLCWNSRSFQNSVKRVGEGGKARKNRKLHLPDLQTTTISSETKLSRHQHFCVRNQTRRPLARSRVAADRNPVAKRHYSCDQFGDFPKLRHRPRRRRKKRRRRRRRRSATGTAKRNRSNPEDGNGVRNSHVHCGMSIFLSFWSL